MSRSPGRTDCRLRCVSATSRQCSPENLFAQSNARPSYPKCPRLASPKSTFFHDGAFKANKPKNRNKQNGGVERSPNPGAGREPDSSRGNGPKRVNAVSRNAPHFKTAESGLPKESLRLYAVSCSLRPLRRRPHPSPEERPLGTKGCAGIIRGFFSDTRCRTGKT